MIAMRGLAPKELENPRLAEAVANVISSFDVTKSLSSRGRSSSVRNARSNSFCHWPSNSSQTATVIGSPSIRNGSGVQQSVWESEEERLDDRHCRSILESEEEMTSHGCLPGVGVAAQTSTTRSDRNPRGFSDVD